MSLSAASIIAPARSMASALLSPFMSSASSKKPWALVRASDYRPVAKNQVQVSFTDTAVQYLTKNTKDVFKAVRYTTFWAGRALKAPSVLLESIGKDASHGKNWFSVLDMTKRAPDFARAVNAFWLSGFSSAKAGAVLTGWAECVNSVNDGLSLVHRYTPLQGIAAFANFNVAMAFLAFSYKAGVHCSEMVSAETNGQKFLTLMKLAFAVSYVAFSSYSLACLATGMVASSVIVVGCLTSALVWSIASHFFDKMYDPYDRNAGVNWDKVAGRTAIAPSA